MLYLNQQISKIIMMWAYFNESQTKCRTWRTLWFADVENPDVTGFKIDIWNSLVLIIVQYFVNKK